MISAVVLIEAEPARVAELAEQLVELVNRAMSDTGRQVNVVQPLCDSRLPNLSRRTFGKRFGDYYDRCPA